MSKPIIGITCDYDYIQSRIQLADSYYRAISEAGGLPLLLPYTSTEDIGRILDIVDGLLFTGGGDVDPSYFGEEASPKLGNISPIRDEMEIKLCREALERDMPVLGICRGAQLINIAMGGTVYQDLESQWGEKIGRCEENRSDAENGESKEVRRELLKHSQGAPGWYGIHEVFFKEGSKIENIMGVKALRVNSFHHQAVCKIAPNFCISGWSPDGVVEAIESVEHRFAIGVQWHPERMWEKDRRMLLPFAALIRACRDFR